MSTAPHLPINILLPSDLLLQDAVRLIINKFRRFSFWKYDGIPVTDQNVVSSTDGNISRCIGARSSVPWDDILRAIEARREQISEWLRQIPTGLALEDPALNLNAFRHPIIGLLRCLTDIPGVQLANATKIVHRHRPLLLPILDSVLRGHYWRSAKRHQPARFRSMKRLAWPEYGFAVLERFHEDLLAVIPQIDQVLQAVQEMPFAGISRVRALESLIFWHLVP